MDDIHNDILLTISLRFRDVIRQNGGDSGGTFVQKPMERLAFCYDKHKVIGLYTWCGIYTIIQCQITRVLYACRSVG